MREGRGLTTIPVSERSSASKRGNWCFSRSETETVHRNLVTEGTQPGTVYDYNWRCVIADGTPAHHGGPTEFVTQASDPVFTPVGELLNSAAIANRNPTPAEIAAAEAEKATADHCKINLSENNKKWLAEGDVMNTQEFTQRASLDDDWVRTQPQRCTHSRSYNFSMPTVSTTTMTPRPWDPACGRSEPASGTGWVNDGPSSLVHNYYMSVQTPELTGLWQSLANHANSGEDGVGFKDALTSKNSLGTAIDDVDNGDASKRWSGSAMTKEIVTPGSVSPAAHLLWGAGASDPQGTDKEGFFDKEAAYHGVKVSGGDAAPLQTQFRDNRLRSFTVNLYKPQAEGVVLDDSRTAITTTVSRWELGTPLPGYVSSKGTFTMQDESSAKFFSGNKKDAAQQRNWATTIDNTYTWGQVRGETNVFKTSANWATAAGQPQVFTVKWEYAPTVNNTIPTTVGFGAGSRRSVTTSVVGVPIQGKVQGRTDGAAISPAHFSDQEKYTGSGSVNELDGVLRWGSDLDEAHKWVKPPHEFSPFYSSLRFVRTTNQ